MSDNLERVYTQIHEPDLGRTSSLDTQDFSANEISWLRQFDDDEVLAADMLKNVRRVGADEFRDGVFRLIEERVRACGQPVALYAERSVRKWNGQPNRLFKETTTKVKRAYGIGPNPVQSENKKYPETGSEGIVANIITQYVRGNPEIAYDHPGPDLIRNKKIRKFILVTDFVGSGCQASRYLQSAWRLASVKSWRSGKFISFEVVAFSAAEAGIDKLEKHACKPTVSILEACPTVFDLQGYRNDDFLDLCCKYGPKDYESKSIPRLGHSGIGALIVFSHGMPNNAPRLFHKAGRNWVPLFQGRVLKPGSLAIAEDRHAQAIAKLEKMRESRLAELASQHDVKPEEVMFSLVLTALKKKPRTAVVVSARTGLSIAESEDIIRRCVAAGWINAKYVLTPKAHSELKYLRRAAPPVKTLPSADKPYYVPSQLRAPK
ncbi:phosphoribosyltransferase-like protein [Poseidonocella sedimentorum]|uniref:phosphoribosyltransferase-like protein n=1 Tax=Poseidonocella sedimentorum TaxID=871652 RepID=UPI0011602668|nr:hypothetical protein [Poseidonocella sedimentorum]